MSDLSSHTAIDWKGHVGLARYGDDSKIIALFYNRSVHNPVKSAQAGTPIHDDVDYVRIHQPGERLNIVDRPVQPGDKQRFPAQWSDYIGQREQIPDGTPISLLFPAHPHVGDNLRGLGVHTIEQCAELSGHAMDVIGMGAQEYVNRAKEYLDSANKGVGLHKLHKDLEERDSRIRVLEAQIGSLQGQLDKLLTAINSQQSNPMLAMGMVREMTAGGGIGVGGGASINSPLPGAVEAPKGTAPKAFMVPPGYKKPLGRPAGSTSAVKK